jgi:hypothetical protein
MLFKAQQKLDYVYDTAIKTLTKASALPAHQIPLGAMLMIGGIPEPMPSSVREVKNKLTELGYL